ncbi:MAG TPA: hypothetical protein VNP73_02395, partial [Actinomycetota bacterium]|nr:hypothetical protein [Actinomycetota bacterium]
SGRYETHWYATASDGAAQAGMIDFNVTGGATCTKAVRPDAKEDVDLGFDVVDLRSADTKRGAKVTVTTAAAVKCVDLTDKQTLALKFDTGADDTTDVEGLFVCKAGKIVLELSSKDGSFGKLAVTQPSPAKLKVVLTRHVLLGQVGVIAESTLDSSDCEGKVCADRAPDLGWLNVY